ncbi:MAG: hypothetical protein DMG70_03165 [Acidobacteria bacterium]|nr:MAG: hypothetical protein DMG70_03165 [Acidobacteriota bacterium]PYY09115.1 MAG: hypothetical protein DMG69_11960 [Acidobacteriota bacterium]
MIVPPDGCVSVQPLSCFILFPDVICAGEDRASLILVGTKAVQKNQIFSILHKAKAVIVSSTGDSLATIVLS